MKWLKRIGIFLLILVLTVLATELVPIPKYDRENIWRQEDPNKVLVMSHAGGRSVNPGNTMRAMKYSADIGVDVLEMDIQRTSDGILVLRHGENDTGNIRDRSNCDGLLYEMTYEEVYTNCNFGYHFEDEDGNHPYRDMTFEEWVEAEVYLTTLEEVFEEFGDSILYNIEIKADLEARRFDIADDLVAMIKDYDLLDHVLVATSFEDISKYILSEHPEVYLSASLDEARDMIIKTLSFRNLFYQPRIYVALQLPVSYEFPVIETLNLTSRRILRYTHKHNMAMHYWTINDEAQMRELIEKGADGIITDDPALLMRVMDELKEE
jgi:glycerophosphoryl diester phosphodiesterase